MLYLYSESLNKNYKLNIINLVKNINLLKINFLLFYI